MRMRIYSGCVSVGCGVAATECCRVVMYFSHVSIGRCGRSWYLGAALYSHVVYLVVV